MSGAALLIGNDINSVTGGDSWQNLLTKLIRQSGQEIDPNNKPFPLLYEEIYLRSKHRIERELKNQIAQQMLRLEPNIIHEQLLSLPIKDILTTNYDLTLEKSLMPSPERLSNQGLVRETLFNLFRHYQLDQRNFWHIHGVATTPGSIILGYEHYSGYLQHMRNYVVSGTGNTYKNRQFKALRRRLLKADHRSDSWLDLFFSKDIYILGLQLDFSEIDLWWLITYRAREIRLNPGICKNRLVYYCPAAFSKQSSKLQLMQANGIEIRLLPDYLENKGSYYQHVLNDLNKSLTPTKAGAAIATPALC